MSEEDLDEAIGDATTDLANTHINGDANSEVVPGVTNKADVENNGVSADEPAPVNQETPPKEQADQLKMTQLKKMEQMNKILQQPLKGEPKYDNLLFQFNKHQIHQSQKKILQQ